MANKPKDKEFPDNEPVGKTTSLNMATDALTERLNEVLAQYPAWKPSHEGDMIAGKIDSIKDFPFMHQEKGSIMAVLDLGAADSRLVGTNDEYVAFWLNTVAQSQLLKLYNEDADNEVAIDADHDTRTEAIRTLVGTDIIIKYTGEQKSTDKTKSKLNAYQKYAIVRTEIGKKVK